MNALPLETTTQNSLQTERRVVRKSHEELADAARWSVLRAMAARQSEIAQANSEQQTPSTIIVVGFASIATAPKGPLMC